MRKPVLALLALSLLGASPAAAAEKMYSYDPADAPTKQRIDKGLTFIFDRGLFGMRVREVLSTEARVSAKLTPVNERELGAKLETVLPAHAYERDVYLIGDDNQGPAMVRAFCPGSTKGWLVFAPIRVTQPLTVQVLGDDQATGKPHHCATLSLAFRGEWRLQPLGPPVDYLPPPVYSRPS